MDHLPGIVTKFQKRIILVWAIAIMWIYIGNIINFHQHHIWGKQLIPVAYTSNRSKEKSIIKYLGFNGHLSVDGNQSPFIINSCTQPAIMLYGNVAAVPFTYSNLFLTSFSLLGCPLRAPPLA
jgi:hypothetical protein